MKNLVLLMMFFLVSCVGSKETASIREDDGEFAPGVKTSKNCTALQIESGNCNSEDDTDKDDEEDDTDKDDGKEDSGEEDGGEDSGDDENDPPKDRVCTRETGEICYGGYDSDANKKTLPVKIILLTSGNDNPDQAGATIVQKVNNVLKFNDHQFFKLGLEVAERKPAISASQYMNSGSMIRNYGSTEYFTLCLVDGMRQATGGVLGYSTGLRNNYKEKRSMLVIDYAYAKGNDPTVLVHEFLHGLGSSHTGDGNGQQDNTLRKNGVLVNGLVSYNELPLQDSFSASTFGDFEIYVAPDTFFQGARTVEGHNFDTRTLMFQFAKPLPLFTGEDNAYSGSYSNILDVYHEEFIK